MGVESGVATSAASELKVTPPPAPTSSEQMLFRERGISETEGAPVQTAEGKKLIAKAEGFTCTGDKATDFRCYESYYEQIIKSKGAEMGIAAAFADLTARSASNPYVLSECHPLTHSIGRFAAESYPDVGAAYAKGNSLCWSGYYHGVLETFVYRTGLSNIEEKINSICASLNTDRRYDFNYFNCVHGLGHGLMALSDNDIPSSLKKCDALTGDWEQQSCAGGAYMENVIADGLNHVTNWLDPKRPLFPCDVSQENYKNTCYLMQTSYMLKINGGDFAKTFEWCRDAGSYVSTCNQSLGRDASGRFSSDINRAHEICMMGADTNEVTNCAIGAVKDIISYFHADSQGKAFCNLFQDPMKQTCLDTANVYYMSF